MPKLIRFYITHVVIGFGLAAAFALAIFYSNVGNIAHLVTHTNGGWLMFVVFWVLNGIVFAGVQFAIAVMSLAEKNEPPHGGMRQMIPIRVPVNTPVRRHKR